MHDQLNLPKRDSVNIHVTSASLKCCGGVLGAALFGVVKGRCLNVSLVSRCGCGCAMEDESIGRGFLGCYQ